MPPRWIKEEDWLRTAGESGERATFEMPLTVSSTTESEPPASQPEAKVALPDSRKRSRMLPTAVTVGIIALVLAVGEFKAADQRASQAFQLGSRSGQAETNTASTHSDRTTDSGGPVASAPAPITWPSATETVGNAPASPAVSAPASGPEQTASVQPNTHTTARHGARRHGKR